MKASSIASKHASTSARMPTLDVTGTMTSCRAEREIAEDLEDSFGPNAPLPISG